MIPDKIEEVNAETLSAIVAKEAFVTALFYEAGSKRSSRIVDRLENIDDEADVFKIRFVKIKDAKLAEEYSLVQLPALVYFRGGIPVVYHGDLEDEEEEVLEWLIQHQTSADEEDVVEGVGSAELDIMIRNVDHVLVLFHDRKKKSQKVLDALEQIDDEADVIGVSVVHVDDPRVAEAHGIRRFPSLVYFEKEIPAVYGDADDLDLDLEDAEDVLRWLTAQVENADIEEVRGEMLDKLVVRDEKVAVLFYDDLADLDDLNDLETIDDDLDERGIAFLKTSDVSAAEDYGVETRPSLVFFEKGVPNLFTGDLGRVESVLEWILNNAENDDGVEIVTKAMLGRLIETRPHVAVFFYDKKQKTSREALRVLDDVDDSRVFLVKMDDAEEASRYGVSTLPGLVLFEDGAPNAFEGDFFNAHVRPTECIVTNTYRVRQKFVFQDISRWLKTLIDEDNIERVNVEMLERLLNEADEDDDEEEKATIAAFVYHKNSAHDLRILDELEKIDDELHKELNVHLVKIEDALDVDESVSLADRHGVDVVPALMLFKERRPLIYHGDLASERKVFMWVKNQLD